MIIVPCLDLYLTHLNYTKLFLCPTPNLNSFQLEILEELIEYLDLKFEWNINAATHLAYPDLAVDKFSATDPDRDAESFIQWTEQKIISPSEMTLQTLLPWPTIPSA